MLFTALLFCAVQSSISLKFPEGPALQQSFEYLVQRSAWVDSVFNNLSPRQRIAQFFMVAAYSNQNQQHVENIAGLIEAHQIGGVIFFQGSPKKQVEMTNYFQSKSKVPLMISIDAEWGLNMRLDSTIEFPRQLTLGAIKDNDLIYEMGKEIGRQCKRMGIHVNLAPVVDVNNNPNNPVINDRSFGEEKYNVALKSLAYMQGLQDAGVIACAKHFPGHGDTDKDSHKTLPVINHSRKRLHEIELYPFKILINSGVKSIMAAHLKVPALDDSENIATSLSRKVTTELLKDSLKFRGLVFSDALNMKGVSQFFEPGEVDVRAFIAGNDVLLFSQDVPTGIEKIIQAIDAGKISQDEVDERTKKILAAKFDLGLSSYRPVDLRNVTSHLNSSKAKTLKKNLFGKAITVVANSAGLLPLKDFGDRNIATVSIGTSEKNQFQKSMDIYSEFTHFQIEKEAGSTQFANLYKSLDVHDTIFLSVENMSRYASRGYGLTENTKEFIEKISQEKTVILTLFGSPYSLKYFQKNETIIVAYENNFITQNAAVQVIAGALKPTGRLPVSVGEKFDFGDGHSIFDLGRIKIAAPEDFGIESSWLNGIDSIAQEAMEMEATPGCQIVVLKNASIIYNRAFGFHTYEKVTPCKPTDLYDLASITKIAATTISLMYLFETGKLDLEKTVADYLPELSDSIYTTGNLQLKKMLTHQSGLSGWIPFYQATIPDSIYDQYYCNDTFGGFEFQVTDSLFMIEDYKDSIWKELNMSYINPNPKYVYSDLGYYIFQEIIQKITDVPSDVFVKSVFYDPMNLERVCFKPLEIYPISRVVPTELDTVFRKSLVHGYVHDPGAAMLGGVGGHAGLFSNAVDLAALMQMLLNGGVYGGKRFLNEETIDFFTSKQNQNCRRGLGFDKPETDPGKGSPCCDEAPASVFGHSGFTGTCVWADPENDLIYVFLSNRVHPDANNWKLVRKDIRTRIQTVLYQAIEKSKSSNEGIEPFEHQK